MKRQELLKAIGIYILLAAILYLFYRSVFAFLLLPPGIIIYNRFRRKEREEKRREIINSQFRDALVSLAAAMRAGYSMENGLKESLLEMKMLYGDSSAICRELSMILNEISLGISTEEAIQNFAARADTSDIRTFSSVFQTAERSGGDLVAIIFSSAEAISAKVDTQNEISVLISSKKLEQNLMLIMPPAIILYIRLSSPGLLDPLYGNLTGVIIMTISLGTYAAAFFISRKIMKINV